MMAINREIILYKEIVEHKMHRDIPGIRHLLHYLFDKIELNGRNILDVGGGTGLLSLYASINDANKVVCLEPELDGSSINMQKKFNDFVNSSSLTLNNIEYVNSTFQNYEPVNNLKFDIMILKNSINHLDENACTHLQYENQAVITYKKLFRKMADMMNKSGKLIITDCTRNNFFNDIGIRSPFRPTIEWQKHQSPEFWVKLLQDEGFRHPKISWTSPNRLGKFGRMFFSNRISSYFLLSHFKLIMDKSGL